MRPQPAPPARRIPSTRGACVQVSEGLPLREKYFITGSYYDLSGQLEKSIPAYEALVREHPNDFWGVNNLALAYHETGRYREEVPLLSRRAALRPNDFTTTAGTATWLIGSAGDLVTARRLVDRAANLDPPNHPNTPTLVAWLKVFPAFELWATGHLAEAAGRLDGMAAEAHRSDAMALAIGLMNLTLGRLRAAEDAFHSMSFDSERQELLAAAALARDDIDGARAALLADPRLVDPPQSNGGWTFGKSTFHLWTMIRAGLVKEAGAYAAHGMFDGDPTGWIHAELAAARGEINVAIPSLERARERLAPGNGQTVIAIETLGEALIRRGDLRAAEEVFLSLGDTRSTTYGSFGSRGYIWLRMRGRLLWLERQLGHSARAREIERSFASCCRSRIATSRSCASTEDPLSPFVEWLATANAGWCGCFGVDEWRQCRGEGFRSSKGSSVFLRRINDPRIDDQNDHDNSHRRAAVIPSGCPVRPKGRRI